MVKVLTHLIEPEIEVNIFDLKYQYLQYAQGTGLTKNIGYFCRHIIETQ